MRKTYESREDYLETIFILKQKHQNVRSIDIVNELGYSKPSISRAMGILRKAKYITIDNNGYIDFTDQGLKKAKAIYEKHMIVKKFLLSLGVSEDTAETDACRIEHIISDETFSQIKDYIKKKDN